MGCTMEVVPRSSYTDELQRSPEIQTTINNIDILLNFTSPIEDPNAPTISCFLMKKYQYILQ